MSVSPLTERHQHKRCPCKRGRKFSNIRSLLAQNTREFCDSTSLHGWKYITNPALHLFERIFFALCVASVAMVTIYFILRVYHKWITTPSIFTVDPMPFFVTTLPFPAVTVCNVNQALKSKVKTNSVERMMVNMLCQHRDMTPTVSSVNRATPDWNSLNEFIQNVSQPCSAMLLGCAFGGNEYNCSELFFPIVTDEGLCCVFNALHPRFMYQPGMPLRVHNDEIGQFKAVDWHAQSGYDEPLSELVSPQPVRGIGEAIGLKLMLNVQHKDFYCSSTNYVGFKVALHSPNELPNVRDTGMLITPGHASKVRITPRKLDTAQNLKTVDQRIRYCIFDEENKLIYYRHYTQRNCEMECMAMLQQMYCNCISFYLPKIYANSTTCTDAQMDCVEKLKLKKINFNCCLGECLPSCSDVKYNDLTTSTPLDFFEASTVSHKIANATKDFVKHDIALVHFYFNEHLFRSCQQKSLYGTSDLVSNIGGIMGLFLGFSFISLAELFYFGLLRPLGNFVRGDRCTLPNLARRRTHHRALRSNSKAFYAKSSAASVLNRQLLQRIGAGTPLQSPSAQPPPYDEHM